MQELGDELRAAKPRVPTRPHPGAPDEPPGNVLVGGAVAVVDRARNVGQLSIRPAVGCDPAFGSRRSPPALDDLVSTITIVGGFTHKGHIYPR
jgi:hypothetical protein